MLERTSILCIFKSGLVSSRASLTSWGEGASLALVGHPSDDGLTIKIPYGKDALLHRPALHHIARSVETGFGDERWW